jgi:4-hydroxythreonine-4-phosphate dehydrogenase
MIRALASLLNTADLANLGILFTPTPGALVQKTHFGYGLPALSAAKFSVAITMENLPRLLITMGDVAGIGPEIIAKAWKQLLEICSPVVVGDARWLKWALALVKATGEVREIREPGECEPGLELIPCLSIGTLSLHDVPVGKVNAAAGQAAFDFLLKAIDCTLAGQAQGIVTCPLHKEGLRAAGLSFPGHTEILAEKTGTRHYAMVLYGNGLGVIHVTLHMALREVAGNLTRDAVEEKIRLLNDLLPRLSDRPPRIGVAALNPHAADGGLFGDEESRIIQPAVASAQKDGIDVTGPWPSDTLFVRARAGEFDGVVAMYHDQGHIALKLMGMGKLVNITAGLPLVRTSVAHGTAYDIAGRGVAEEQSLVEAARVAARLATPRKQR